MERHHKKVFSAFAASIDRNRFQADSAYKYSLYFDLLARKMAQYNIEPAYIYNIDEKGFLIRVLRK